MKLQKFYKYILHDHKLLLGIFVLMLLILLIRIPLGTFNQASYLDTIGHFILPAVGAPILFVLLSITEVIHVAYKKQALFLIFLLGIAAEVLWEVFEFTVDNLTNLHWQLSNSDTMVDILLAVTGSLCGAIVYNLFYFDEYKIIKNK